MTAVGSASKSASSLVRSLLAGLVVGSVVVIVAISFGALVFSGPLAAHTAIGIGLSLAGAAVLAILVAMTSSLAGMVATPQDSTAAIVALIAASCAAALPQNTSSSEQLLTVVGALVVTTSATGLAFFLLGHFRLGGLVRYLPYPVIGGFLAGTGWLLVRGSIGVMADLPLTLGNLQALVVPAALLQWVPGALLAITLLVVLRRVSHYLALPLMLLGSVTLFYVGLLVSGTSLAEAQRLGLLLGPFPESALWRPLGLQAWGGADWSVVGAQLGSVAPVMVVGVIALLLNATGLELSVQRDIDLDRELRSAGLANLICGVIGGLPGFQTLSLSLLGHRISADSRLVGVVSGLLCGLTLLLGGAVLSLMPRACVGGLLLFLGLAFLVEWVIDAYSSLPAVDYAVVLVILLAVAWVGFLESVGAGIVIAVVLFVVNYSRVDVIRNALTGTSYQSQVDRPVEQLDVLSALGDRLIILRLQGYLFFGTANGLLDRLRQRLDAEGAVEVAWVVIDFRLLSGLDSSAVLSFVKLQQLAQARGFGLVVTGSSPEVEEQLTKGGFLASQGAEVLVFGELDRGVEYCENALIVGAGLDLEPAPKPIRERLQRVFKDSVDISELLEFFERREAPIGTFLMRAGDAPDDGVFVLESGRVTVQLEVDDGPPVRVRTMGPGSILGEIELYLGIPRSASVVTETVCVFWQISAESLLMLQQADPVLASRFHRFMCRVLADRLAKNNQALRSLMA